LVTSYDLWPGNGASLLSKEKTSKGKSKEKGISGRAYDVNKQTIYVVPESTNESRAQYFLERALGLSLVTQQGMLHQSPAMIKEPRHTRIMIVNLTRPCDVGSEHKVTSSNATASVAQLSVWKHLQRFKQKQRRENSLP